MEIGIDLGTRLGDNAYDGEWIYYVQDHMLYKIKIDGTHKR